MPADQSLEEIFRVLSGAHNDAFHQISVPAFVFLLGVATLGGAVVATSYRVFRGERAAGTEIHRTLPLLTLALTAIFVTVQFSLPLSLGLLGALTLTRFRTPVKEPEETGVIMLVVAVAAAAATFSLTFLGVTLLVSIAALALQRTLHVGPEGSARGGGVMVVALPGGHTADATRQVVSALGARLRRGQFESITRSDEETVIAFVFPELPAATVDAAAETIRGLAGDIRVDVHRYGLTPA